MAEPPYDQTTTLPPPYEEVPPPRRRRSPVGLLLIIAVVAALVGVTVWVGLAFSRLGEGGGADDEFVVPLLDVSPGEDVPRRAGVGRGSLPAWAQRVSERTEIPARVLLAYGRAERTLRAGQPGCRLTWTTLAGVGLVESKHATHSGGDVREDGRLTVPIIGPALDGSPGVLRIRDTDRGRLDGDRKWDRAVGPMQFLPSTWREYAARPGGGRPDPQDVDDAALTAGRLLCARGGDLGTPKGWWQAVLGYNNSAAYGREVYSGADAYARAVTTKPG